jgi:predicted dinucleotide-binding enzyme
MKIAILGTGGVGKAFATRLTGLGHQVIVGTRNVASTMENKADNGFAAYIQKNPAVKLGSFSEAAAFGEIVINVTKGANTHDVIKSAGIDNLKGKIIMDISNPLDFSKGMPPSLIPEYSNTNSLGEEIQKMAPGAKVVKTLNTMWNGLMLDPNMLAGGNHINYICGNDADAKKTVIGLLNQFGWKNENIMDLGDITGARATEATLPIWLRVYGTLQSGAFNFNVIR